MKLYVAPYAPNPRRVMMFLAEKDITDIELVTLNLQEGEHRTDAFRAKSPLSQIPTLELDDGRTLTESRAICGYIEAMQPEPNLMGRDAFERAFIEMWDRRMELLFSVPLMMWVRHGNPVLGAVERDQNAEVASYNQGQAMRMAKWLNSELGARQWIAGDRFTIADITAACGMDFAKMMRWRPGDDLPHLKRWRGMLGNRAAGNVAA
ncbi:glutathione S-transferase family protein [Terricaulis silvestris]|uniref:glutathione transferase n=1 Tax=Terricaulis silvestris TaxID=2686094 RepID=A0A6I6MSL2_9CAUL|nr:glutathione S-transferase family protein [Terricaulis silvestris]QGZ94672.1 putative GST-like protein YibF [Terricaulis silvestris]